MRNIRVPVLCEPGSLALRSLRWVLCCLSLCLCVSWIAEFAKEKEAIALSISQQMVRHTQNGMRHACRHRGPIKNTTKQSDAHTGPLSALSIFFSACLLLHVD